MLAELIAILAAADAPADPELQVIRLSPLVLGWAGMFLIVAATAVGAGLLTLALGPARHALAAQRLGERPFASFALGLVVLVPLGLCVGALLAHPRPGGNLVAVVAVHALALGWSVAARALGERAAPTSGPVAQTLVGLAAILLPCALVVHAGAKAMMVGLPVAFIAAHAGLGAWLLARRGAP